MAQATNIDTTQQRLTVELVTPTGRLVQKPVDEIIAPGALGEFGILPGHIAFLSALHPGVLTLRDGQKVEHFAVGRGYAQVGAENKVVLLVDKAKAAGDVDRTAAAASLAQAETELATATPELREAAVQQVEWHKAQLDAQKGTGKSAVH